MTAEVFNFNRFWLNEAIPGHRLLKPAIWLEKTVSHIISALPKKGCAVVGEVAHRVFLSLLALLASLPVALLTLFVALPIKGIAYSLCFKAKKFREQSSDLDYLLSSSSSKTKTAIPALKKSPPPLASKPNPSAPHVSLSIMPSIQENPPLYPKSNFRIQEIPRNGNCAFVAFLDEMKHLGFSLNIQDIADFRMKSALWIADNAINHEKHPKLQKYVLESIEEYLEVKQRWLDLEEDQIPISLIMQKHTEEEKKVLEERRNAIPKEKEKIQADIRLVQAANAIEDVRDLFMEYLKAIQSDLDTERVYASQAHYYAFTRMFGIHLNVEILLEREKDYNLISEYAAAESSSITLRFLHKGQDHVDLLVKLAKNDVKINPPARESSDNGEIEVPNNGDCLFSSFRKLLELEITPEEIQQERKETVEWILSNYAEDLELQRRLINSLSEHFHTKIEQLKTEILDLEQNILSPENRSKNDEASVAQAEQRKQEIPHEITLIETEVIPKITLAFGIAHSEAIHFQEMADYVPGYLSEMSDQGVHGGAAELYALCQRYKVCAKVHRKEGNKIEENPYEILCSEFESAQSKALLFTHTHNHYNPYIPKI